MKTNTALLLLGLASVTLALRSPLFGQGTLTPPGAPAPTMKSLDQIEARTPISSAPYTISQPGSYYLTTNLSVSTGDAITVSANGVTLDLNGFAVTSISPTASGNAILLGASTHDITIRNGHIVSGTTFSAGSYSNGPGFMHGIRYGGGLNTVLVSNVTVSGCKGSGIDLAFSQTVVESCSVTVAGSYGITASSIRNCVAANCGLHAIFGNVVTGSFGSQYGPTNNYGIFGQVVQNSYGVSNSGFGIYGYSVVNCYGQTSSGTYGILGETIVAFSYGSGGSYGIGAINLMYACSGFPALTASHQYFCGSGPTTYP